RRAPPGCRRRRPGGAQPRRISCSATPARNAAAARWWIAATKCPITCCRTTITKPPISTACASVVRWQSSRNPPMSEPSARNGVTRDQALDAVRTLLRWAGEDPAREGLIDTPRRVVDAYGDWFSGYADDPTHYLSRTFEEVAG